MKNSLKGNLNAELVRNNKTVADFTDKNFIQAAEIYSAVKYSYELGDMNKSLDMKLFKKFAVENDNIENAQTDLKLGTVINVKNISVNTEIGKEFGKRDREYIKAGFTYTFLFNILFKIQNGEDCF